MHIGSVRGLNTSYDLQADFSRIRETGNDAIKDIYEQSGADLVMVVINSVMSDHTSMGLPLDWSAPNNLFFTRTEDANLARAFGYAFGCQSALAPTVSGVMPFINDYGWWHSFYVNQKPYSTIMDDLRDISAEGMEHRVRLPLFSNPDVRFGGVPIGTQYKDCARTVRVLATKYVNLFFLPSAILLAEEPHR